jgi:hypothetical protein
MNEGMRYWKGGIGNRGKEYWTGEEKNRKGKGGKERREGDDGKGLRWDGGRVWEEGERGIEEEYNINKYMCMCNNI